MGGILDHDPDVPTVAVTLLCSLDGACEDSDSKGECDDAGSGEYTFEAPNVGRADGPTDSAPGNWGGCGGVPVSTSRALCPGSFGGGLAGSACIQEVAATLGEGVGPLEEEPRYSGPMPVTADAFRSSTPSSQLS